VLKVLTGVVGTGAAAVVGLPAVGALVDVAGKRTVVGADGFVPVARLAGLPEDGSPVQVPVVVEAPRDAWNLMPPTTVGAVFVRREGDTVTALSSVCPHLGCGIDWRRERLGFECPCHESSFAPDGAVAAGPSPRPMDALEARVVDGRVEVRFQQFATGRADRVPV
jgi:menaquinol-cytochrome c reductase iron-sulfur subunit